MDRQEFRAVDEDEGSCPHKQVNWIAKEAQRSRKIDRSAEAFRARHCPFSFPPIVKAHHNTTPVKA
jgi:hypothetical protein